MNALAASSLFLLAIFGLYHPSLQQKNPQNTCATPNATVTLYSDYLTCLSQAQNGDAQALDGELVTETKRATQACFANSVLEAKNSNKCFFQMESLEVKGLAWSPHGPLKDCSLCVQFAKISIEAIIGADQDIAKCVRKLIFPAIARESGDCLKKSITGFSSSLLPEIPDFEVESMKNPANALEAVSIQILQNFRLEKCNERNPDWAKNTETCLKNPPVEGYFSKHCNVINVCHAGLSDNCLKTLKTIETPTCRCFDVAAAEIKKKLLKVGEVLKKFYTDRPSNQKLSAPSRPEVETCVSAIRNETRTPANNWFEIIDKSIQTCGRSGMRFEPLLRVFCGAVIREVGVLGNDAVDTSFKFLGALIDALIHRMSRYCTENCPKV